MQTGELWYCFLPSFTVNFSKITKFKHICKYTLSCHTFSQQRAYDCPSESENMHALDGRRLPRLRKGTQCKLQMSFGNAIVFSCLRLILVKHISYSYVTEVFLNMNNYHWLNVQLEIAIVLTILLPFVTENLDKIIFWILKNIVKNM